MMITIRSTGHDDADNAWHEAYRTAEAAYRAAAATWRKTPRGTPEYETAKDATDQAWRALQELEGK